MTVRPDMTRRCTMQPQHLSEGVRDHLRRVPGFRPAASLCGHVVISKPVSNPPRQPVFQSGFQLGLN